MCECGCADNRLIGRWMDQHRTIEKQYSVLRRSVDELHDYDTVVPQLQAIRRRLIRHMLEEDIVLFPLFGSNGTIAQLEAEHVTILTQLDDFVATGLVQPRAVPWNTDVEAWMKLLVDHIYAEDQSVFPATMSMWFPPHITPELLDKAESGLDDNVIAMIEALIHLLES